MIDGPWRKIAGLLLFLAVFTASCQAMGPNGATGAPRGAAMPEASR